MEAHNARTHLTDLRACDPRVIMALPPSSGFLNGLGSAGRENDDDDDDDLGLDSFELSAQLSPPRGREGRGPSVSTLSDHTCMICCVLTSVLLHVVAWDRAIHSAE